jgi:hypothetical protein
MTQLIGSSPPAFTRTRLAGYKVIFVVSFLLILSVALAASMVGLDWRAWFPGAEGSKSLMKSVTAGVYTFMPNLE